MRQAGGGRIVNILNTGAKTPGARSLPTSVSRAAGLALTKALSKELAPDGILVNAVCIGPVKSGQWERRWSAEGRPGTLEAFYERMAREREVPLGRIGEAEELGALVTFLVSAAGRVHHRRRHQLRRRPLRGGVGRRGCRAHPRRAP